MEEKSKNINKEVYIVYKTTNLINSKIYYGVHKTLDPNHVDYLGCGVRKSKPSTYKCCQTPFQRAVTKYGPENFKRETVKIFDKLIDALDLEAWIVTEEFIKLDSNYNIVRGGNVPPHKLVPIHQYDLKGNYIQSFDSISFVYNFYPEIKSLTISRSIQTHGQTGGFMWSYEKVDYLPPYDKVNKKRKVGQYTLDGELVKIYDTVRACKKDFCGCVHVLAGTRNSCKGFTFKYIDD